MQEWSVRPRSAASAGKSQHSASPAVSPDLLGSSPRGGTPSLQSRHQDHIVLVHSPQQHPAQHNEFNPSSVPEDSSIGPASTESAAGVTHDSHSDGSDMFPDDDSDDDVYLPDSSRAPVPIALPPHPARPSRAPSMLRTQPAVAAAGARVPSPSELSVSAITSEATSDGGDDFVQATPQPSPPVVARPPTMHQRVSSAASSDFAVSSSPHSEVMSNLEHDAIVQGSTAHVVPAETEPPLGVESGDVGSPPLPSPASSSFSMPRSVSSSVFEPMRSHVSLTSLVSGAVAAAASPAPLVTPAKQASPVWRYRDDGSEAVVTPPSHKVGWSNLRTPASSFVWPEPVRMDSVVSPGVPRTTTGSRVAAAKSPSGKSVSTGSRASSLLPTRQRSTVSLLGKQRTSSVRSIDDGILGTADSRLYDHGQANEQLLHSLKACLASDKQNRQADEVRSHAASKSSRRKRRQAKAAAERALKARVALPEVRHDLVVLPADTPVTSPLLLPIPSLPKPWAVFENPELLQQLLHSARRRDDPITALDVGGKHSAADEGWKPVPYRSTGAHAGPEFPPPPGMPDASLPLRNVEYRHHLVLSAGPSVLRAGDAVLVESLRAQQLERAQRPSTVLSDVVQLGVREGIQPAAWNDEVVDDSIAGSTAARRRSSSHALFHSWEDGESKRAGDSQADSKSLLGDLDDSRFTTVGLVPHLLVTSAHSRVVPAAATQEYGVDHDAVSDSVGMDAPAASVLHHDPQTPRNLFACSRESSPAISEALQTVVGPANWPLSSKPAAASKPGRRRRRRGSRGDASYVTVFLLCFFLMC